MASATPVQEIQEETKCPICLEYLTDPVTIHCGHNFCRGCITRHCETWTELGSALLCCPSCRARIPKGQLHFKPGNETLCERHSKALDLFCEEDGEAMCVICERSPQHRSHMVLLMEEAAQKYKVGHTLDPAASMSLTIPFPVALQKQIEKKRQQIVAEFQQLHQFLEEQEQLLLAQLEKLEKEITKIQDENITKVSEEISCLSKLISELEGKCQKPASEFLQVRLMKCNHVKLFLSRCEKGKFQQPEEISPELEKRLSDFFPENLNVTLDPGTAHPELVLFRDGKSVTQGDTRQRLPNNPERFDTELCVLGCEGFTSGRHCWEVEVGDGECWAVGVARESVGRKGEISRSPEGGIWAVQRWEDQFQALTSPETPLPLPRAPSRIRVCLDCDRGQVTFIDAGDEAPIFTFPPGSVPGGRIRPWIWVGPGSRLSLCP
uniref:Zinc finger protein RFP-like n=1 Tax=Chelonoidis abingdonii TaxID=106734 RepID=A0A8C0H1L2_CHEAB